MNIFLVFYYLIDVVSFKILRLYFIYNVLLFNINILSNNIKLGRLSGGLSGVPAHYLGSVAIHRAFELASASSGIDIHVLKSKTSEVLLGQVLTAGTPSHYLYNFAFILVILKPNKYLQ